MKRHWEEYDPAGALVVEPRRVRAGAKSNESEPTWLRREAHPDVADALTVQGVPAESKRPPTAVLRLDAIGIPGAPGAGGHLGATNQDDNSVCDPHHEGGGRGP